MANVLSLAMKINADASGFKLDPVQRALVGLGTEADKVTAVFDKFKGSSEAAGRAQEQFAQQAQGLVNALRDGGSSTQFAADFEKLAQAARVQAAAFEEGARVTESVRTAEERRATELERLDRLLQQNAITEETYNRAKAEASGANAAAAQAEKERIEAIAAAQRERDKVLQDGVRITQQFATVEEKRAAQIAELDRLLAQRAITEETYARALAEASGASKAAADAAKAEADVFAAAERQRQSVLDEGRRITEQYRTVEEKRAAELERIGELLRQGAISEETAARAKAQASGANEAAAAAERQRADALAAASRIIQANLTPQERYDAQMQELRVHLDAGRLSQQQFNRAASKAQDDLNNVGRAAGNTDKNIESLTKNVRLLSAIEIGRVLIDGFQALSGVFQRVTGQITSLVTSVNSSLDTLNDFSARTGIGVEALQGYSLAAKLAGVDTEQFGVAVQRLAVTIGKAAPGDQLDKSLRGIGLSVAELRSQAPERQFSVIGEAISQLPTAADRAAAAVQIFGRQGAALAPLFRDGAASIQELRAEAQQLGAIVGQTQINNVAAMNDAFDKVRATVQGIVGQVIGNLAPAVTAVTDQFLEFVRNFNSGEGGTGIANAITDVLLQGAERLAEVFDFAVNQFNQFSGSLASASEAFRVVGNIFSAVGNGFAATFEGLRVVFNTFELAGNALMAGLGNFLAGLGSWVSTDLQVFGEELARAANEATERNTRDLENAAKNTAQFAQNAATALTDVFTGGSGTAGVAGRGAATEYIRGLSEELARGRLPEFKVQTGIEASQEKLRQYLKDAGNGADEFLRQSEATLSAFQKSAEAGGLNNIQVEVMLGFMDQLNEKLDTEAEKRRQAVEETAAQVEADQKRVEALLRPADSVNKLEEDLAAVYREQTRVQEQLAAARAEGSSDEADQAAATLARLDQAQAKLEEIQQAQDQGFGEGFGKAFEETSRVLDEVIDKAAEFGNEGAQAAEQLRQGIFRAQQQVEAGILTASAYQAEVTAQRRIYEERLAQLDNIAKLEQQRRDAEFQSQIAANDRLNAYMQSLMGERQRAEAAATEAEFNRRAEAAENLKAIEDRITLQRKSVEAAREQNDLKSARARQQELKALEDLRRAEQAIVDGKQNSNRQIARAANTAQQAQLAQQQVIGNTAQRQIEATQQASSNAIGQVNNALAAAANKQRKLLEDLNTLGSRTVNTADVRTAEGAAIVLGLAANAQDPRLIEARLTNKRLREVAVGLTQNLNRIGIPAAILG